MSGALYAVYGASGFGRQVMPLARIQLQSHGVSTERLVFVDDNKEGSVVNDQRVLSYAEFIAMKASTRYAVLAIADSNIREDLATRCAADGVIPWTISATNAVILDDVTIGDGAVLSSFVLLTSNIRVGHYFHANHYSYVAHDCVIGDFVTFAAGVKCSGNVIIEDHVYVGSGALLKQGTPELPLVIGRGAIIGMGAVVTKSVSAGVTVVGNPAKPLIKKLKA